MNRTSLIRVHLKWVGLLGFLLTIRVVAASAAKPNFIVILGEGAGWSSTSVQMDDRDPASRGGSLRTPGLERLAASGMRFALGYAASPRCTPSRAALITGKSPAALHMTFIGDGAGGRGRGSEAIARRVVPPQALVELPDRETTIAELLKPAGYASAHFGKWHLGRVDPQRHGFDESDGPTGNGGPDNVANPNPKQAVEMTRKGIDFMERQVKAGRPFYLQLSHYPSQDARGAGPGADGRRMESDAVNACMEAIQGAVERLGLRGTTYVVYTTDHGTPGRNLPLAGGKGTIWEGGVRVPFIVSGPGIQAGACSHVRVTACDLVPTFAELAGVAGSLPPGIEGGSLVRLMTHGGEGRVARSRDEFVVHFPHYDKDWQGPASALWLNDEKLVRIYETDERRLYNVARDPYERRDLASEFPESVRRLDARLSEYLATVHAQMPQILTNLPPGQTLVQPRGGRRRNQDNPAP
jgi:arylsulfatase A-like enzyme